MKFFGTYLQAAAKNLAAHREHLEAALAGREKGIRRVLLHRFPKSPLNLSINGEIESHMEGLSIHGNRTHGSYSPLPSPCSQVCDTLCT